MPPALSVPSAVLKVSYLDMSLIFSRYFMAGTSDTSRDGPLSIHASKFVYQKSTLVIKTTSTSMKYD